MPDQMPSDDFMRDLLYQTFGLEPKPESLRRTRTMPNEIDVKELREKWDWVVHTAGRPEGLSRVAEFDGSALLDEIERLRGERSEIGKALTEALTDRGIANNLARKEYVRAQTAEAERDEQIAAKGRALFKAASAEVERDALKEKLEYLERSYDSRNKQAEELDVEVTALKAKLERVREEVVLTGYSSNSQDYVRANGKLLAILDGKEGEKPCPNCINGHTEHGFMDCPECKGTGKEG